jgi:GTP-binding protein
MVVNIQKSKMLTNIRAAGRDRNLEIAPPVRFTLEEAIEYIADDELVEVTPKHIRLRKRLLTEYERKCVRRRADK